MSTDDRTPPESSPHADNPATLTAAAEAIAEACRTYGKCNRRSLRYVVVGAGARFGSVHEAINRAVALGLIEPADDSGRSFAAIDTTPDDIAA